MTIISYPSEKRIFAKGPLVILMFAIMSLVLAINYWTVSGENTELRNIIKSLRSDLDESIVLGRKRSEELSSINAQLRNSKVDNSKAQDELKKLSEDIDMKNKLHGELDEQFQGQLRKLEELQDLYSKNEQQKTELQKSIGSLQEKLGSKQALISELESKLRSKDQLYKEAYNELQEEKVSAQKKDNQLQVKENELQSALKRNSELSMQIQELHREKTQEQKLQPQGAPQPQYQKVPAPVLVDEKLPQNLGT